MKSQTIDAECDYFNRAWLEFTGRTLEQELDSAWAEGVHPEDLDHCMSTYRGTFAARESFEQGRSDQVGSIGHHGIDSGCFEERKRRG